MNDLRALRARLRRRRRARRASACSGSRSSTGAPSTSSVWALAPRRRQRAAHRRHRLGQVDAGRRHHDAARAAAAASPTTRPPAPTRASARCAPTCSGYYKSERSEAGRRGHAGRAARPQQLLGDPRRASATGLRPDASRWPRCSGSRIRRASRRASTSSPSGRCRSPSTSPASARDIAQLRKRLRSGRGVELYDSFPPYGAAFRRRFGIEQRAGARAVPPDRVDEVGGQPHRLRAQHMLEPFDVEPRIAGADRATSTTSTAPTRRCSRPRRRSSGSTPLVADCDAPRRSWRRRSTSCAPCRDALRALLRRAQARSCCDKRTASSTAEIAAARRRSIERLERRGADAADAAARRAQAGDRARTAATASSALSREIARRAAGRGRAPANARERYDELRRSRRARRRRATPTTFFANRGAIAASSRRAARARRPSSRTSAPSAASTSRRPTQEHAELDARDRRRLKARRTNIPARMLAIRARAVRRARPRRGRPAVRRRADPGARRRARLGRRGRAPAARLRAVAAGARRALRRRRRVGRRARTSGAACVYYRVRARRAARDRRRLHPRLAGATSSRSSRTRRSTTGCERELGAALRLRLLRDARAVPPRDARHHARRPDQGAAASGTRRTTGTASTTAAATCSAGRNEAKIARAGRGARRCETRIRRARQPRSAALQARAAGAAATRLGTLQQLAVYRELPRARLAAAGRRRSRGCEDEQRELRGGLRRAARRWTRSSTQLEQTLAERRDALEERYAASSAARRTPSTRPGGSRLRRSRAPRSPSDRARTTLFPTLEALRAEALGEHRLTVESCDSREQDMRDWLQARIDADDQEARARLAREDRHGDGATIATAYPLETSEVDASVEAGGEYRHDAASARAPTTCRASRRASRSCSTRTPSARSPTSSRSSARERRDHPASASRTSTARCARSTTTPAATSCWRPQPTPDAEVRDFQQRAARLHRGRAHRLGRRPVLRSEVPAGEAHHRALPRPRGPDRARPALDAQGDRRAQLVRVLRLASAGARTTASTSTTRTPAASPAARRRSSPTRSWPPASPTSSGWNRARRARAPSASWSSTRRSGAARTSRARYGLELFKRLDLQLLIVTPLQKIHIIEPYVVQRRLRAQRGRQRLHAAQPDHRGVPRRARRARRVRMSWTPPADLRAQVQGCWDRGRPAGWLGGVRTAVPAAPGAEERPVRPSCRPLRRGAPVGRALSRRQDARRDGYRLVLRGTATTGSSAPTACRPRPGSTRSTMRCP